SRYTAGIRLYRQSMLVVESIKICSSQSHKVTKETEIIFRKFFESSCLRGYSSTASSRRSRSRQYPASMLAPSPVRRARHYPASHRDGREKCASVLAPDRDCRSIDASRRARRGTPETARSSCPPVV